ncbi:MAG: AAA family ATPase [Kangiellaceae bacterium]|nr:AAA family ATPase [Kangiellaceae bacterium]|tara:strand:- start:3931 stop:4896 length:966 start_codon:yes stop_codon:yes gene_type:complete
MSHLQSKFDSLGHYLNEQIIGQQKLVERLLIAMLADGHLLVEGAPGLAKTRAIKCLSDCIEGNFHRVQFTPDLLPSDLTGTDIFRQQTGNFEFQKGPLFHNLILADEINRSPAKVQSALLEAMAERQITVGKTTYPLSDLFLVMATQNPLEQEGTYPLPEAQLDRFLLHVNVDYPDHESELKILRLTRSESHAAHQSALPDKLSQEDIFQAREEILNIHLAENLEEYIVSLIMATRNPGAYLKDLSRWILAGASPRATIALEKTARAHAWLAGRDFVSPEDIHQVVFDVLRHRLFLSYEASAENISADQIINHLLNEVAVN